MLVLLCSLQSSSNETCRNGCVNKNSLVEIRLCALDKACFNTVVSVLCQATGYVSYTSPVSSPTLKAQLKLHKPASPSDQ